jgi:hypothetical protein
MATDDKSSPLLPAGTHAPWWRSSLYHEPVWVSLVWLLVPLSLASLVLYIAITR